MTVRMKQLHEIMNSLKMDSEVKLTSMELGNFDQFSQMIDFTHGDLFIESEEVIGDDMNLTNISLPSEINTKVIKSQPSVEDNKPRVEIIEQPRQRGLRFRYQCEGRSAGSVPGEHSTAEKKSFPTIRILNHRGSAIIVVSCVSKDYPHKPHPHALVGKDCKKGVCTVKVKDTTVISFPHLGIQCAKKKGIQDSLNLRKEINVDPYQTGFEFTPNSAEMSVVRLCFQVFLPDENGKIAHVLAPVVSQPIHDKKTVNDLVICRIDKSSGKARGCDEIFLLCDKVNKDDIHVRFYEEDRNGSVLWEGFGDFGVGDVHRQFAIVFKSPQYRDIYIKKPCEVLLQLLRPSDGECSEPIGFTYMPEDPDPDRIEEKRKRKAERMQSLEQGIGRGSRIGGANLMIKEGLRSKLKASRKYTGNMKEDMDTQDNGIPNVTNFTPNENYGIYTTDQVNENINPQATITMRNLASDQNTGGLVTYNTQGLQVSDNVFDSMDAHLLIEYIQDNTSLDFLSGNTTEAVLQGMQGDGGGSEQSVPEEPVYNMSNNIRKL